MPTATPDPPLQ
jgi:hypothetical protein